MNEDIRSWPVRRLWDGEPGSRLSTAVQHLIVRAGMSTVGDLLADAEQGFLVLSATRGFGPGARDNPSELKRVMAKHGLIPPEPPAEYPEPGEAEVQGLLAWMMDAFPGATPHTLTRAIAGADDVTRILDEIARHLLRTGRLRRRRP